MSVRLWLVVSALATVACGASESTGASGNFTDVWSGDRAFQVEYDYLEGLPGDGSAVFVWRETDGERRWDMAWLGRAESFVEMNSTSRICWFEPAADAAHRSAYCYSGQDARGIGEPIQRLLSSDPTMTEAGQQDIAGRDADCYRVDVHAQESLVCVSPEGTPLRLELSDYFGVRHVIVARQVSDAVEPIDPLDGFVDRVDTSVELQSVGLAEAVVRHLSTDDE